MQPSEPEIRTCPNCGKVFSKSDVTHYWWYAKQKFCALACEQKFFEPKISAMRATGEPLLEIGKDYLTCRICGEQLQQLGAHFQRKHGLPTPKGRIDRMRMLNLPLGTRVATMERREFFRKHFQAVVDQKGPLGILFEPGNKLGESNGLLRKGIPVSEDAVNAFRKNVTKAAYIKHVNACIERPCKHCRKKFTISRHQKNVFCSQSCASAARIGQPSGITPEGRAKIAAGTRAYRATMREDRVCLECGTAFNAKLSEPKSCCSRSCGMKYSRRRRKAAAVLA